MNLYDYLIEHQAIDWNTILADWHWLLPTEFEVWLMNKYGDLVLVNPDNSHLFFDVGNGTAEKIADNREDFCNKIEVEDNANCWLMIPLIEQLKSEGIILKEGYCYSFLTPPILGGKYSVKNTITLPIIEHYGVYASIYSQIKNLPDGASVRLKVIP